MLVIPNPPTPTARVLGAMAEARGLATVSLSTESDLSVLPAQLNFFGGPRLAAKVQAVRPLTLLEPTDDWLVRLPQRFVRRTVRLLPALEVYGLEDQWFVKMPREKGLPPGPYFGHELPTLPEAELLLVSELVTMASEFRFWVLDGVVHASSCYRRHGDPYIAPLTAAEEGEAVSFMDELLSDQGGTLPAAVVVDVAWITAPDPGWAVVEANMAWYSDHYAADPSRVLDVVLRSAYTTP